jgi:hypothetical protein
MALYEIIQWKKQELAPIQSSKIYRVKMLQIEKRETEKKDKSQVHARRHDRADKARTLEGKKLENGKTTRNEIKSCPRKGNESKKIDITHIRGHLQYAFPLFPLLFLF